MKYAHRFTGQLMVSLDYRNHLDPSGFETLRSCHMRESWGKCAMHFVTPEVEFDKDLENNSTS